MNLVSGYRRTRSGRTTAFCFDRHYGPGPKRWSVSYTEPPAAPYPYDRRVFRTFSTKIGCRLFAWRLGRIPVFHVGSDSGL